MAVGRAIVRQPKAFLFDEPLSNLDAKLRIGMRAELKRLHRTVQTTTIYVTHDQEEAMTLGDRVVVMKDGIIHQYGTPFEVYQQPANRFVAGFVGTPPMNFFDGRLVRGENGRLEFDEGDNRLVVSERLQQKLARFADQPIVLGARPETIVPASGADADAGNVLRTQVTVVEPLGERMDVYVATPRHDNIICRVDARVHVDENTACAMAIDMERAHFFEPTDDGRNVSDVAE